MSPETFGKNSIEGYLLPTLTLYLGFTFFEPQVFAVLIDLQDQYPRLNYSRIFFLFNLFYLTIPVLGLLLVMLFADKSSVMLDCRLGSSQKHSLMRCLTVVAAVYLVHNLIIFIPCSHGAISLVTIGFLLLTLTVFTPNKNTWRLKSGKQYLTLLICAGAISIAIVWIGVLQMGSKTELDYEQAFVPWESYLVRQDTRDDFLRQLENLKQEAKFKVINTGVLPTQDGKLKALPEYQGGLTPSDKIIQNYEAQLQLDSLNGSRAWLDYFHANLLMIRQDVAWRGVIDAKVTAKPFEPLFKEVRLRSLMSLMLIMVVLMLLLGQLSNSKRVEVRLIRIFLGTYVILFFTMLTKVNVKHLDVNDKSFFLTYQNWYFPEYFKQVGKGDVTYDQREYDIDRTVDNEDILVQLNVLYDLVNSNKTDLTSIQSEMVQLEGSVTQKIKKKIDSAHENTKQLIN